MPNTTALRALTDAAHIYHQAYIPTCQEIFMEVLTRELDTHGHTTEDMSFFELDTSQPSRGQLSLFHQRVRNSVPQKVSKERSLTLPILRSSTNSRYSYDVGVTAFTPRLSDVARLPQTVQLMVMLAFLDQTEEWRSWAPRGTFQAIVITFDRDVDWKKEGSTDPAHIPYQLHWREDLNRPGCLTYILLQPYKVLESPVVR